MAHAVKTVTHSNIYARVARLAGGQATLTLSFAMVEILRVGAITAERLAKIGSLAR